MGRRLYIFLLIYACFSISSLAVAQPIWSGFDNYARVERQNGLALAIGVENGRNYFQALNQSNAVKEIALTLTGYSDINAGEIKTADHNFVLDAYEIGDKIYIDTVFLDDAWVKDWSSKTLDNQLAEQHADRDARPFFRAPPSYPPDCMYASSDNESIVVSFDVSETGGVENILIRQVTNGCHALAAHRALRTWVYAPKIIDGAAVRREGVETRITFQLIE